MIKGFSLLELVLVLSLGLGIMAMVVANVAQTARHAKKATGSQERLEGIFHTVDCIKSDLSKCGMRLQEAAKTCGLVPFIHASDGFALNYGLASEALLAGALAGDSFIAVAGNDFFKKNKPLLVYDPDSGLMELNEIRDAQGDSVTLRQRLKNNYRANSQAVACKRVEYKYFPRQRALKRKVDGGTFQPLLDEVTDFFVSFFAESKSVLYRLEINRREQVRGYIFLLNLE